MRVAVREREILRDGLGIPTRGDRHHRLRSLGPRHLPGPRPLEGERHRRIEDLLQLIVDLLAIREQLIQLGLAEQLGRGVGLDQPLLGVAFDPVGKLSKFSPSIGTSVS